MKLQKKLNKQQVEANGCVSSCKSRYGHNLIKVTHKASCYIIFTMKVPAPLGREHQI
jgi:hypothetical protein